MSYLLDALRKSEDLKQRGVAPTIHSAERYHRPAYRSRWLGMILLVLLPLAILLAWYSWTGRAMEDSSTTSTSADSADATPDRTVAASAQQQQERPPASPADRQTESTVAVRLTAERTPVERLESHTISGSQGQVTSTDGPSNADTPSTGPVKLPVESGAVAGVRRPEPAPAANTDVIAQSVQDSSAQVREYKSPRPGVINVWELPESVRSGLMDMKISVLVFAERPEDRFLLMNGKRWVEGDEPQAGLFVEEIRREGVVFSFRLYQFLVSH